MVDSLLFYITVIMPDINLKRELIITNFDILAKLVIIILNNTHDYQNINSCSAVFSFLHFIFLPSGINFIEFILFLMLVIRRILFCFIRFMFVPIR